VLLIYGKRHVEKELLAIHFQKGSTLRFNVFINPKKVFPGHKKVLGGPHVARGPDVVQAWTRAIPSKKVAGADKLSCLCKKNC